MLRRELFQTGFFGILTPFFGANRVKKQPARNIEVLQSKIKILLPDGGYVVKSFSISNVSYTEETWCDKDGKPHRVDGPSHCCYRWDEKGNTRSFGQQWHDHGIWHRENGPACINVQFARGISCAQWLYQGKFLKSTEDESLVLELASKSGFKACWTAKDIQDSLKSFSQLIQN